MMNWDWIPLQRVGVFLFGAEIDSFRNECKLEPVQEEYSDSVGWEVYGIFGEDVRIFVENEVVVQLACYESIKYDGVELIGLSIDSLIDVLGFEPTGKDSVEIEGETQVVYEFDDLEAQFWTSRGRVTTVFCGPPEEASKGSEEEPIE